MSRPISSKLKFMLEEINQAFGHAARVVLVAYSQAITEGFSPTEAKDLIFQNVRTISRRTIYYYLPDECKDKHMQQIAFKKRAVQFCTENSTDEKIEEDNASSAFMEEFRSKLDTRKLTPEIMKCSEMLDEKDIVIDKNKEEIIELKKIIGLKESSNSNWIILRDEQAQRIYSMVIQDKENNSSSEFAIEHDGHYVLGIENLN